MNTDQFRKLEAIFDAMVELGPGEREARIDEACDGDAEMGRRLRRMLEFADRRMQVHLVDVLDVDGRNGDDIAEQLGPDARIGPYEIHQRLGEGGFGAVYRAYQVEPVQRDVALKLIRPGMDTRQVIARFETERRALALMDHPNIARVLDAGETESGRPYFVMDLVNGVPITSYCDAHRLTMQQRLALVVPVCEAVQHAHQKGIIHRDLKPSNILVAVIDGRPIPKVIDFGIAKATDQGVLKGSGAEPEQLVGTPEYMSPEQADPTAGVDTRTDVYSLGIVLYELLTGTTPFESEQFRNQPMHEIRRVIREHEPPRPSTRLSTLGAELREIAGRRRSDPGGMTRTLRGDLDWIVMKALERDPDRRYMTAYELAGDLERHLEHRPVAARAPTLSYRVGKFARRHRTAMAVVAFISIAMVVGAISATWGMLSARKSALEASAVNEFMADVLTAVRPDRAGPDVALIDVIRDASARVSERFAGHDEMEGMTRLLLGRIYWNLSMPREGEAELLEAVRLLDEAVGPNDARTLKARQVLAYSIGVQFRRDESEAIALDVLARQQQVLGPDHADTLNTHRLLNNLMAWRGDYEGAIRQTRELLERSRRALGDHAPLTLKLQTTLVRYLLFDTYSLAADEQHARLADAEALLRSAIETETHVNGDAGRGTLEAMEMLAGVYLSQGRTIEAAVLAREVLDRGLPAFGDGSGTMTDTMVTLYGALYQLGEADEAADWAIRAVEARRDRIGDTHPSTLAAMSPALSVLHGAGRHETGEAYTRTLLEVFSNIEHDDGFSPIYTAYLGMFLMAQGRSEEAAAVFEPMLAGLADTSPEEIAPTINFGLGMYLAYEEQHERATGHLTTASAQCDVDGELPDPVMRSEIIVELIRAFDALERYDEADSWRDVLSAR